MLAQGKKTFRTEHQQLISGEGRMRLGRVVRDPCVVCRAHAWWSMDSKGAGTQRGREAGRQRGREGGGGTYKRTGERNALCILCLHTVTHHTSYISTKYGLLLKRPASAKCRLLQKYVCFYKNTSASSKCLLPLLDAVQLYNILHGII